jgi:hypothetical protein
MRPQAIPHPQQPGHALPLSMNLPPEAGATQALRAIPPPIPELKPKTIYGIEPKSLAGYNKWYIVDKIGLAEKQAGALLDDIGIICLLPGKMQLIDSNLSHKARSNFRGVYVSNVRNLRCYYFNPSYRKREMDLFSEAASIDG